jgi:hypothetical protein
MYGTIGTTTRWEVRARGVRPRERECIQLMISLQRRHFTVTVASAAALVVGVATSATSPVGADDHEILLFESLAPGFHAAAAEVPDGICAVTLTAAGGDGGRGTTPGRTIRDPGRGSVVTARIPLDPGTVLDVMAGGRGADGADGSHGGVGGGGGGGRLSDAGVVSLGGGGGGASAVSTEGTPLLVAGAGGGSAAEGQVGDGGALGEWGGDAYSTSGGSPDGDGTAGFMGGGGGGVGIGGPASGWSSGGGGDGAAGGGGGAGLVQEGGPNGGAAPGTGLGGASVGGGLGGVGTAPGGRGADGNAMSVFDPPLSRSGGGGGGGSVGIGGGGGGVGWTYAEPPFAWGGGGGGGAGWGGGTGSFGRGGGGGGSSYLDPTGIALEEGHNGDGDGWVVITYDPEADACPASVVPPEPDGPGAPVAPGTGVGPEAETTQSAAGATSTPAAEPRFTG